MTNGDNNLVTDHWTLIKKHPVFNGLDERSIREMIPFFRPMELQAGELLAEEGLNSSYDLYLVLKGELEVVKLAAGNDHATLPWFSAKEFTIAKLKEGDAIGELSFIKGSPRSASIRSLTNSMLLSLPPESLAEIERQFPASSATIMKNLLGYVSERLKQTSTNEVNALRVELQNSIVNSKANIFFSYVIGLLCFYNLAIHKITSLSMDASRASIISAIIIVAFGGGLVLMIKHSELPIQIFGLTTKNWKSAVRESLIWSFAIIASLIFIKWILISTIPRYHGLALLNFDLANQKYLAFNFTLYGLHSPIQEFIARGVLQGSLQHFFKGKNIILRAIIISNALFSATHVHLLGGLLGVIVFVPGLFWGWMYSRHGNLIGVSISHILIGWTGLFFLDLESLF